MFNFHIVEVKDGIVFVRNMNKENTFTREVEKAVEYVNNLYGDTRIVYRTTMGEWYELCKSGCRFLGFKPYRGYVPF